MTAALLTALADPWFDAIFAIGIAGIAYCTAAEVRDRRRFRDDLARFDAAPPPDVQQQRARIAKRRTAEAEARIRALGHHGGAEFQQAEYAEACGWVPARAWDTAADLTALDEVETPADMFGGEGA